MYTGQFWNTLRKRIEERVDRESERLARGSVPDFARYQNRVGYIEALDWAITEARDILGDRGDGRIQPDQEDD